MDGAFRILRVLANKVCSVARKTLEIHKVIPGRCREKPHRGAIVSSGDCIKATISLREHSSTPAGSDVPGVFAPVTRGPTVAPVHASRIKLAQSSVQPAGALSKRQFLKGARGREPIYYFAGVNKPVVSCSLCFRLLPRPFYRNVRGM